MYSSFPPTAYSKLDFNFVNNPTWISMWEQASPVNKKLLTLTLAGDTGCLLRLTPSTAHGNHGSSQSRTCQDLLRLTNLDLYTAALTCQVSAHHWAMHPSADSLCTTPQSSHCQVGQMRMMMNSSRLGHYFTFILPSLHKYYKCLVELCLQEDLDQLSPKVLDNENVLLSILSQLHLALLEDCAVVENRACT